MPTCCACLNVFEGENPPILTMSGYGRAMVLCPECAALVERVAGTPDSPDRDEAIDALSSLNISNRLVSEALLRLISREDMADEEPIDEEPMDEELSAEAEGEDALEPELIPEPEVKGSNMSLYIGLAMGLTAALVAVLLKLLV